MTLDVKSILTRARVMDNYSYLLIDEKTKLSAIIDPSEVAPIVKVCNDLSIKPDYVLNTHHHFDHTDGNLELKKLYNLKIVGAEDRIPGIDIKVKDGETWALGESIAHIIDVSAHTQGHILWYFKDDKMLFTGDTLFNLCIGGLFEGTPQEMFEALKKIKLLPDDVSFYPGHEYTMHGVEDALRYNPSKELLEYVKNAELRLSKGLPVHPTKLGIEKKVNPYLQANTLEEFTRT
ncbi:MAG: hydroxyacylglutathione hydrolase [Lactobacillus sp.]|jgi:hydroxyacylglutathione hydrolase|nr:hydroxyacylglutathione hydrolase [Lactobacillus sp.]